MAITLQERRKRLAITSAAGLAMVGVIVLLLNGLAHWVFIRLDLTRHGAYSLSLASKKLVRNLEDPVIIKAFFTPDLPPPYNAYHRYVRDLLTEYRAVSRGRVRFEFALAHPPQEFEKEAAEANLMPIQFEQLGSDQLQIRRGYMGLVLYHRDHSEVLPVVKDIQQVEYDITSRIARMAVRAKKVIAVTSGHGETVWQMPPSKLAGDLAELYELRGVALPPATTSPLQADLVLVVGPKQKFDEKSIEALDQAIRRGIPAAFLVDAKNLFIGQFFVTSQDAGLGDLLKRYGIQLGDRLVYDAQCETIGISQNLGGLAFTTSIRYRYVPLVTDLAKGHPLTRGLEAVALPFVTAVEPVLNLPKGVRFTPLLSSSARSWLAPAAPYASVAPQNVPQPGRTDPHGPYTLGGLLEGTNPETSIFVLGTARLVDPELPAFSGAEALVSNILAYLSKDDTLLGVRSKGQIIRPLKPVSGVVRSLIQWGIVLGVTFLPVLVGLWRWRARRAWRRAITAAFTKADPSPLSATAALADPPSRSGGAGGGAG